LPSSNLGQGPFDLVATLYCKFDSDHAGVCQFVFTDGHVVALSNMTNLTLFNWLVVRNGGQIIDCY
jgi:prepilin-type processing-associated H-X9-DG protein